MKYRSPVGVPSSTDHRVFAVATYTGARLAVQPMPAVAGRTEIAVVPCVWPRRLTARFAVADPQAKRPSQLAEPAVAAG